MFRHRFAAMALECVLLMLAAAGSARAQTLEWTRQLGTSAADRSRGVSADVLGNVYISGWTGGSLDGTSTGEDDAFISKYDASGTLEWTRQLGTSQSEESYGVSADGLGNVYISGWTRGSLGGVNAGYSDAFVSKYDASGMLEWTRQRGTGERDENHGVSADGLGNVYVSGWTRGSLAAPHAGGFYDAIISKYDASGTLKWTRQLGSNFNDTSWGVSADGLGSVYISGWTVGSLGGANAGYSDAFISKYNASGMLEWTRQLGTSSVDRSWGVSADGLGNVYISGDTTGSLGATASGGADAFLIKYDQSGTLEWTRQLGTSSHDASYGVSADGLGNVYISGATAGTLGRATAGGIDAFISKYDASGTLAWTRQLGTSSIDRSWGVFSDGLGNVYLSGDTLGSLGGTNFGEGDLFVAKYSVPAEPVADFNGDGHTDGDDFMAWQAGFGTWSGATKEDGDYDNDGDVDGDDFLGWQANFGSGSGSASAAVPEPSSWLLVAVGLALCLTKRSGPHFVLAA